MVPSSQDKSLRIAHLPSWSGLWLLLLTFLVLFAVGLPALASAPETWTIVESKTTEDLQKITYGSNIFVAVGHNGTIVTSSDAVAWKISSSGTSAHLYSAAYGRNLFVVAGEKGLILTSPDGLSWTARNSGTDKLLYDIIFANDRFTAVGYDGTILNSTDGITWSKESSAYTEFIPAIAYGSGTYSAVNVNGNTMTSTDSVTWTKQSSVGKMPRALDYAQSKFTAISYDGTISTSPDGKAWSNTSIEYMIGTEDITTDGTYFVSAGAGGKIFYSTDGTAWTPVSSGINQHLNGGCFGNNEFVIVGDQGAILKTAQPDTTDEMVPGGQKIMRYQIGSSKFTLNGDLKTMDTAPRVVANRTMLPIRFVAAPLGASVKWTAAEKKTTITFNGKTIELWTGRSTARVNGVNKLIDSTNNKVKPYVVPPGRTMLPLRFIAESLGCDVKWDAKTKQITITYPKP